MRRLLVSLCVAAGILITLGGVVSAQSAPVFKLGFLALADRIPEVVGAPLENEYFNLSNGNSEQHTTKGLMVWRKVDNWTAYTNGHMTWINGPVGVQSRLNTDRFDWEKDPVASAPAAASGIQSESPAGNWVTSSYFTAKNYYAASDQRWEGLLPRYRVWFNSVEDLLKAFPDRQPAS